MNMATMNCNVEELKAQGLNLVLAAACIMTRQILK